MIEKGCFKMNAESIMKTQVIKVMEDSTVRSVIEKFIKNGISGLPVVNDQNEIVGYISDGDIMRYVGKHKENVVNALYFVNVLQGDDDKFEERAKKILDYNVMEVARKSVYTVKSDEDIEEIARILGKKQIKKLPVEQNGILVGIISRGDVIRNAFSYLL
ncbi:CBS domain protein sometimes clustered with YjeE [Gracilibacillus boraciitolerans JCM 21714]|uniref:CBS domain protein sometimes clustered with YjeE n=2 Tax=Gracilibacillus boraciitolerans TaxID=307521 RepID=W4VL99_9BACI|nr:CBS domain protein sometimes clustered with YjeE [Gracilibacillus boraciitolerans JCM 21714]